MTAPQEQWYRDRATVRQLPRRYQLYAAYSRAMGDVTSRRVRGGSFMLRAIQKVSSVINLSTVARIRGVDGLCVLGDFADERILEVVHEIRGENPEFQVMRGLLKQGDTFVDVGANFGTFSLLAARLVGPSGKVLAIEPQARLAQGISASARLSLVSNCVVRQAACGAFGHEASLLVPRNDSGRAGMFAGFSARPGHDRFNVYVSTLDEIVREDSFPGRMLIKIDVEGSELDVLAGADETVARYRPRLMIELNPWSAAAASTSTAAVVDRLQAMGYSSFATMNSFPSTVLAGDIPLDVQSNLVALS